MWQLWEWLHAQRIMSDLYFVAVVPDWSKSVARLKKKSHRGSPILLLVSCAATRIVELNR